MTDVTVEIHDQFSKSHHDPLIRKLHIVIQYYVKALAILMVGVIMFGVLDVIYVGYKAVFSPPYLLLDVSDIFRIFGAFMVVLIARKLIILHLNTISAFYVFAIAATLLALDLTYFLIEKSTLNRCTSVSMADERAD